MAQVGLAHGAKGRAHLALEPVPGEQIPGSLRLALLSNALN